MFEIMQRKPKERSKEYVKRVLLHNIISLDLKPGEQIQEAQISDMFNVSRTPVREALIELAQVRLIDIYPQKGTYVSLIDLDLVEEGRYLRSVLDSDLAAMACDAVTQKSLDKLHENIVLQTYYENRDVDKFMKLDDEFHKIIYIACDKPYLYEISRNASFHFDRIRKLRLLAKDPLKAKDAHEKIMQAIENRDKERSYDAMASHLSAEIFDHELMKDPYRDYFNNVKKRIKLA